MNRQERLVVWVLVAACFTCIWVQRRARLQAEAELDRMAERWIDCTIERTALRVRAGEK